MHQRAVSHVCAASVSQTRSVALVICPAFLQKAPVLSQQTMTAWVSALQAHALLAPGTCGPLIQAALAASLELPTEHSAVVLEGLAGIASKAGKLLLQPRGIVAIPV